MPTINITLTQQRSSIHIERGVLAWLGERLRAMDCGPRVLLGIDANVAATHGETAVGSLTAAGFEVHRHHLVADEAHKSLSAVRGLYDALLAAKLERGSVVVALGGGIVGDLAGFAAATYMRGVPVVQVPTTLLAMVDASIGGKTGVNFARPDGTLVKNLIGAFWQPRAVFIDPLALLTLNDRHFRSGLAECVKHAMIADAALLTFIESNAQRILAKDFSVLAELIERCVRIKAAIVQEDERETGRRAVLNLGHTFGHAIEPIPELDLEHGEAVAIGLIAAMRCAVDLKRMSHQEAQRVRTLLENLKLPTQLPKPVSLRTIQAAMAFDKKVADGRLRLIVPIGLGNAAIVDDVSGEIMTAALRKIGAD